MWTSCSPMASPEAYWESNHRLAIWRKPTHWNLPGACALRRQPLGREKGRSWKPWNMRVNWWSIEIDCFFTLKYWKHLKDFGSTSQSLQCFDSGPMAVSSIIGHVGGIHVEVRFWCVICHFEHEFEMSMHRICSSDHLSHWLFDFRVVTFLLAHIPNDVYRICCRQAGSTAAAPNWVGLWSKDRECVLLNLSLLFDDVCDAFPRPEKS